MGKARVPGFTLIELMLVTLLLGVLTAASVPLFQRTFRSLALEDGANNVARTMDYARERAIMEGLRYRVSLDPEEGTYRLSFEDDEGAFQLVRGRVGGLRRLPWGVHMEAEQTQVTFAPNGAGTDAELVFSNDNGETLTLEVDGLTGRVARDEG
ncbi:MAG: GspH/FimT family protein [Elusimicrobiota bacterium]